MLRRHHRFFQSLQVLRDSAVALIAFYAAYVLRFSGKLVGFEHVPSWREAATVGLTAGIVWAVVAWLSNLYVSHRTRPLLAEIADVFKVCAGAFIVVVAVTYFVRDVRFSRVTLVLWGLLSFALVSLVRSASRLGLRYLRRRGYNLRHVLVVGAGELAERVLDTLRRQSTMGMRAVGLIAHDSEGHRVGSHVDGAPVLGVIADLGSILARHRDQSIDQVIIALPIDHLGALKEIMRVLSRETVDVRLVPDVYQYATLCGSVEEFSGLPLINLQSSPLTGWNRVTKRAFDSLVAGAGLLFAAPVLALIAVGVRVTSPGPVLFRQQRVGLDGRTFDMFKFRTMRVDAEASGAQWTVQHDVRRTAFGSILRRLSLDELPQLWNVVVGDMSLVGPRPEQPAFIDDFKREIPRYALRHKIKAGMTGWAQVNGMRGNTSIERRIEMDLYYIENWSLFLDIKILLRTLFGGFLSPHAY